MEKTGRLAKPLLILFGIVVFFIIAEVGFRLGGLILNSQKEILNNRSLQRKGVYRILCLGESTTAAGGRDSYPAQLEEILNKNNLGLSFSVINKGEVGVWTRYIVGQLERNLDTYKPDMVIVMMGVNDRGEFVPENKGSNGFLKSLRVYKLFELISLRIKSKTQECCVPDTCIQRGWNFEAQGRYRQAESAFKRMLEYDSLNVDAYVGLGWVYRDQGRWLDAEREFKKALQLDPRRQDAYLGIGWCLKDQSQYAAAEELFKKAIALNPHSKEAYIGLGWSSREQGRYDDAELFFMKALEFSPQDAGLYCTLGEVLFKNDKFMQAEEAFNKSVSINPRYALAYNNLSELYRKMNKPELAREYQNKAQIIMRSGSISTVKSSYQELKAVLNKRGIRLVCVQYPLRSVGSLKELFSEESGIIFVDNDLIFKQAVNEEGYEEYFLDMFAGDFGHCTPKGNRLLAENIANTILKEYFGNKL